jgi:hypothetical protein
MSGRTPVRRTLVILSAICVVALVATATMHFLRGRYHEEYVPVSAKKGVGTWDFRSVKAGISKAQVSWYYNWTVDDSRLPSSQKAKFVPMVWGADAVTETNLERAKASGAEALLAFNEPDRPEQANMTVQQAIDLWPKLEATGLRLGSPSPAADGALQNGWLDWFLRLAQTRGYRVDFIALHWYGQKADAAAVQGLRDYLQSVYDRYGLPIWLTEFALIDFATDSPDPKHASYPPDAEQARFIKDSTAMLETLPFVERYAWFALPTQPNSPGSGLCREDGTLTAAGQAYRQAGVQGPAEKQ